MKFYTKVKTLFRVNKLVFETPLWGSKRLVFDVGLLPTFLGVFFLFTTIGTGIFISKNNKIEKKSIISTSSRTSEAAGQIAINKTLISHPSGNVPLGDTVTFRIVYSNTGADDITSLSLIDSFPSTKLQYLSSTTISRTVSLLPTKDNYIDQNLPTTNNGAVNRLDVLTDGVGDRRGLMEYDLSSYTGNTLTSAEVFFYIQNGDGLGNSIEFYGLTTSWDEGGSTWNNATTGTTWTSSGADYSATLLGAIPVTSNGYLSTNLPTGAVQNWIDNPASNNGMAILNTGDTRIRVVSTEGNPARLPFLEMELENLPDQSTSDLIAWNNIRGLDAGTSDTVEISFLTLDTCITCENIGYVNNAVDVLSGVSAATNNAIFSIVDCSLNPSANIFYTTMDADIECPPAPASCDYSYNGGACSNITLNAGENFCINSGVFSCEVIFNGGTVYVAEGATFSPSVTNNFSGTIINCGTTNFQSGLFDNGSDIQNYGEMYFPNATLNNTIITNNSGASIEMNTSVILNNSSIINNTGRLEIDGNLTIQNGTLNNNNDIFFNQDFIIETSSSILNNYGRLVAQRDIVVNYGGGLVNECSLVALRDILVNSNLTNDGLIYANNTGSEIIINGGASITNNGDIVSQSLVNNSTVLGSGNFWIFGFTQQNGGAIGTDGNGLNFYDATFDQNGSGNILFDIEAGIIDPSVTKNPPSGAIPNVNTIPSGCAVEFRNTVCTGNLSNIETKVLDGISPFTFLWETGETTPNRNNVPAGDYALTVTDAYGCSTSTTISITESATALTVNTNPTDVDCNGNANGSIVAIPSGGTAAFTYLWNDPLAQTTDTARNLIPGTYTVTVTDANNCTATSSEVIAQPDILTITTDEENDVLCNGGDEGNISITVTGGTPNYTYLWDNGATTEDITTLTEGTYIVTVTDDNDCTASATFTLTEPDALSLGANVTDVNCYGGDDGFIIDVTVTGGVPDYSYEWNDYNTEAWYPFEGSTDDESGGGHHLTTSVGTLQYAADAVERDSAFLFDGSTRLRYDNNTTGFFRDGFTERTVMMWIKPDDLSGTEVLYEEGDNYDGMAIQLEDNTIVFRIDRFGSTDDEISITNVPNDGAWHHIAFSFDNGDLVAYFDGVFLGQVSTSIASIQYHGNGGGIGGTFGSNVFSSGGNYEGLMDDFRYSNIALSPSQVADIYNNDGNRSELIAGSYTVQVTDANGCQISQTFNVSEPDELTIDTTITYLDCNGDTDAAIDITVAGGELPYTYAWSNLETTQDISGLSGDTYTVTVTDGNSCTVTISVDIVEPEELTTTITDTDVLCYGASTGAIQLTVNGGTGPFTYQWNNGVAAVEDPTGLDTGIYMVTVTDANLCTTTNFTTITQPDTTIIITPTVTDIKCFGDTDGEITLALSGDGVAPYNYTWSSGQNTRDISGVPAGTYTVTVTDANLCQMTSTMVINSTNEILITANVDNVKCNGDSTGAVLSLTVTGGVPDYSYIWEDMGVIGFYPWEFDSIATDTIAFFTEDKSGNGNDLVSRTGSMIYDDVDKQERYSSNAFDGSSKYQYSVTNGGFMTAPIDFRSVGMWIKPSDLLGQETLYEEGNLGSGIGLRLDDDTLETAIVILNSIFPLDYDLFVLGAPFPTDGAWHHVAYTYDLGDFKLYIDGIAVDSVETGLGTFSLDSGSQGGFGANFGWNVFVATDYTVAEINSMFGSSVKEDFYTGLMDFTTYHDIALSEDQLNDLVDNTGSRHGLFADSYTVTVYDQNGCSRTETIAITEPDELIGSVGSFTNITCYGADNGIIDIDVVGGTTPYTYEWSDATTNQDNSALTPGTYTVTITDFNDCSTTVTQLISEPDTLVITTALALNYDGEEISCFEGNDGSISTTVLGGTSPYTFEWSAGAGYTSSSASGLSAGTYTVTVTDARNCADTASFTLNDPPEILVTLDNPDSIFCYGDNTGRITSAVTGGIGDYTYLWNTSETTSEIRDLTAGTYTVTVSDKYLCSKVVSITIGQPDSLAASISLTSNYNGFPISCNSATDGSITSTITGGEGPYTYLWNSVIPDSTSLSNIGVGSYQLDITDANGCVARATINLNSPTDINFTVSSSNVSDCGSNDGAIGVVATGGVGAYEYRINALPWQSSSQFYDLSPGTYDVYVRSAFGTCIEGPKTVIVGLPEVPIINNIIIVNPTTDVSTDGSVIINASGNNGNTTQILYRIPGFADAWQSENVFNNMSEGVYTVEIRYYNQTCISSKVIELIAGAGVVGSNQTSSYCSDDVNGAQLVETYFIPLPEDQLLQSLGSIFYPACDPNGIYPSDPVQSYTSIGIVENGVIIYYDHWEDSPVAYEPNLAFPVQPTTEIWGDGNPSNGMAPGYFVDVFNAGDRIILDNAVVSTTRQSVLDYDGGDKIASQGNIAVTRLGWTTGPGTLLAGALEVYPTVSWGTNYRIPVGQNSDVNDMFSYTGAVIMAAEDSTVVTLPSGGTVTLSQGQSHLIDGGLNVGSTITSNKDIQVHLLTGDLCAGYESRFFTLKPVDQWSDAYYAPVSTSSDDATYIHVYNPSATTQITVEWETSVGAQAGIILDPNESEWVLMPNGTGAKFFTNNNMDFYAIATVDSETDNSAHDWGYALIPQDQLTSQITLVSFAPGYDPSLACDTETTVSKAGWSVSGFDSENNNTTDAANNAIDGNTNTMWHTEYRDITYSNARCSAGFASSVNYINNVSNSNNALGAPNNSYAILQEGSILSSDGEIHLNLSSPLVAGDTYDIRWRSAGGGLLSSGNTSIRVREWNGSSWVTNPLSPNTSSTSFITSTFTVTTASTSRISIELTGGADVYLDALSYDNCTYYEIDAYNGQTENTCTGFFLDSGGRGGNYNSNENYTVTFCTGTSDRMEVAFSSFNIENQATCNNDKLSIYDGNSTAATLLGDYCGTNSPGNIIGSGSCLTFQFISDGVVTAAGWEAEMLCVSSIVGTDAPLPHEIEIDLGSPTTMSGFRYTPRQDGNSNGHIRNYEFYVSNDGINWGMPIATGEWSVFSTGVKSVSFPELTAGYVKLVATSEINGNPWTSMAEFDLVSCSLSSAENAAPVWITVDHPDGSPYTGNNVEVCIDHDGNGGSLLDANGVDYDEKITMGVLDRRLIYDPDDFDQSGTRIWVCDGSDAIIAGAWGQDPAIASDGLPAIDLGVGLPNGIPFSTSKCVNLSNDFNQDGLFDECDEVFYTIIVANTGALPLSTGALSIIDTLPSDLTYIENTTFSRQNGVDNVVPDAGTTPFPLDETGHVYSTIIMPGDSVIFTFEASINDINVSKAITNIAYVNNNSIGLTPQVSFPVNKPEAPLVRSFPADVTVNCDSIPVTPTINEPNCTFSNIEYPAAQAAGTQAMDGQVASDAGGVINTTFNIVQDSIVEDFRVADNLYPRSSAENSPCGASTKSIDFTQRIEQSNEIYNNGATSVIEMDFNQPVEQLSFNINDLDEGDYFVDGVEVHIYDASGMEIPYQCGDVTLGTNVNQISANEFQASDDFDGLLAIDNTSDFGDLRFSFAGLLVKRVEIILKNKWNTNSTSGTTATSFFLFNGSNPNASHGVGIGQICYCVPGTDEGSIYVLNDCGNNVVMVYSENRIDGLCLDDYTIERTWTFTDNCGNDTTHTQTITVEDNSGPILLNTPTDITVDVDSIPPAPCVGDEQNLATGGSVSQSSTGAGLAASRVIDGNTSTFNQTSEAPEDLEPWWELDLQAIEDIGVIELWNRPDALGARTDDFYIFVSDVPFSSTNIAATISQPGVFNYHETGQALTANVIPINRSGRYIRIQLTGTSILNIAEVKVIPPECVVAIDNCSYASITFEEETIVNGCSQTIQRRWIATDNCGQVARDTQFISLLGIVNVTASVTSEINCAGGNDGEATAVGSGDFPNFTYSWSDSSNQTTAVATGLVAGTYTVTVTDNNGCTNTTEVELDDPNPIILNVSAPSDYNGYDVSCFGASDGTALAAGSGGTGTITYLWNDNVTTTASYSSLSAGTYTVTATDANNCTAVASITLIEPASIDLTIDIDAEILCNGLSNGAATATASSMVPITGYSWSSGQTTPTITGMEAGTYTVVVTDQNGCTGSESVTFSEPDSLIGNFTIDSDYNGAAISCAGLSDGELTIAASGGFPGYTYAWNNGDSTVTADSLSAGTYIVTITDANLCQSTASFVLEDPELFTADSTITGISCFGANDGTIDITPSGGTAGYTILWSNSGTSFNLTGLSAGTYTAVITDANLCTVEVSGTIIEPEELILGSTITNSTCISNGSIDLEVTGGIAPMSYSWSNSATSEDLVGLAAGGTFTVTVTDGNNCTATHTATVVDQRSLAGTIDNTGVVCYGQNNGILDLTVSGGGAPYTFSWNNSATSEDLSGLSPGTYTVTITDANTCQTTASATIAEPDSLDVTYVLTSPTCHDDIDGVIDVTVTGGTANYSYVWNTGPTSQDLSGIGVGTYTVTVTDANLCEKVIEVDFNILTAVSAVALSNTDNNGFDVSCNGGADGEARVTVGGGTPPYTYLWNDGAAQTTQIATNLGVGTYTVIVSDANLCTATSSVTLDEPSISVTISSATPTAVTCNGLDNGSIDLEVQDGVTPYAYSWTGPSGTYTTQDPSGLSQGTYTVTVSDGNSCTTTTSVTINEPDELIADAGINLDACTNEVVLLTATATGGTIDYDYEWSNGATTDTVSIVSLVTTTYTVTITDANSCTSVDQVTITTVGCTEICNDGVDNDGNGLIDCLDPACIPIVTDATLVTCDNSGNLGQGTFILHDANPIVTTESGVMISYHSNLAEAQSGVNSLISPYNSGNGAVYVRVERITSGCFAVGMITLVVDVKCAENCGNGRDDDGDGLIDCDDPDCPCCNANAPTSNGLNKKDP